MKRRDLLKVFAVAPAVILTPGLLMPVSSINLYDDEDYFSHLIDLNGDRIRKLDWVFSPKVHREFINAKSSSILRQKNGDPRICYDSMHDKSTA